MSEENIKKKRVSKLEINVSGNGNSEVMKVYSFDEAFKGSLEYFKGDDMAATNWVNKYALKDSKNRIYEKNPDEMHWRLAKEISRIEKKYPNSMNEKEVYDLLKDFRYIIPQGGPMSGIGNNLQKVSLSNCFVIGNGADSYGGIMKTDEEQVQLMKRRGGVGHDLSHIRPSLSPVDNSALSSTGVVSFMERFSNSTREVAQDGRRGALMLSLSIKHPDAEEFIDAKMTPGKITGANVSVKIDDKFMYALKNGEKYIQQYPIDSKNPLITREIDPNPLWEKIIHNAWNSAEPGILFWDTIKRESIPDSYTKEGYGTISTNPCGEIPLCPYDSCRLLALNLYGYVENPFTKDSKFNYDLFKNHVGKAQRIMDDIIDLEIEKIDSILNKIRKDPEDKDVKKVEYDLWNKIKHKTEEGRRTGVGITAEGDMLASLGIRYGSEKSIEFSRELHKNLALSAYRSSVEMAKERGSFEIYDSEKEKDNPFIQRLKEADEELYSEMTEHGRRNIALLTIAPTGTVSQMTQTTSGLEPAFDIRYTRRRKVNPNDREVKFSYKDAQGDFWEEFDVLHHKFEDWLVLKGYDVEKTKKLDNENLEKIIEKSPYKGATSKDIDWVSKVKMQGAVQKWVDHSISVTVNLPEDASKEIVEKVYKAGWEEGCKGITIYREGSRQGVLISVDKSSEDKLKNGEFKKSLIDRLNRPRPEFVGGMKEKIKTPHGYNAFVSVNWEKDSKGNLIDPYEAFIEIGKAGDDISAMAQGYGRLISLGLKVGMPPEEIISQLKGIGGSNYEGFGENKVKSLPDAIGIGIEKSIEKEMKLSGIENEENEENEEIRSGNLCTKCGGKTKPGDGCEICLDCGYTLCG